MEKHLAVLSSAVCLSLSGCTTVENGYRSFEDTVGVWAALPVAFPLAVLGFDVGDTHGSRERVAARQERAAQNLLQTTELISDLTDAVGRPLKIHIQGTDQEARLAQRVAQRWETQVVGNRDQSDLELVVTSTQYTTKDFNEIMTIFSTPYQADIPWADVSRFDGIIVSDVELLDTHSEQVLLRGFGIWYYDPQSGYKVYASDSRYEATQRAVARALHQMY